MTADDRQKIRQARDQAQRQRLAESKVKIDAACACPVCIEHLNYTHGIALYNSPRIKCRCHVCKQARRNWNKRHKRERERTLTT